MRSFRFEGIVAVMALLASIACVTALAQTKAQPKARAQTQAQPQTQAQAQTKPQPQTALYSGMGSAPTKEDMGDLAFTSGPSGKDLPPGSGTVKQGEPIYLARCAMCHGEDAEGVRWQPEIFSPIHGPRLGGGTTVPVYNRPPGQITTLAYAAPWPEVIFNTIAVEMPMFRAGTLTPDQVYALTAFILFKNGIIKEDEVMNRETLTKVQMPNRKAFPASDNVYLDMKKRGCYKTYGVCLGD